MKKESKRDKFVRLAEHRVNNALKSIELIGNLSNKGNYDYTEADYKKIIRALKQAIERIDHNFQGRGKNKFKL